MNKKITLVRLQKEQQSLKSEPLSQALVSRDEVLSFHFCLLGLEEDFAGGFYHGVIDLPEDYPFSPPKIQFLTENGRFEVGKSICTTFTHYHKETWSSSWNIRTILTALISFMYSDERGIGGLFYSSSRRKALAKKSLKKNLSDARFLELFGDELVTRRIMSVSQLEPFKQAPISSLSKPSDQIEECLKHEYEKGGQSRKKSQDSQRGGSRDNSNNLSPALFSTYKNEMGVFNDEKNEVALRDIQPERQV